MKLPNDYDGPRLMRPDEARASERLSQICFGQLTGEEPPRENGADAVSQQPEVSEQPEDADPSGGEVHVIARNGAPVSQIYIVQTPLAVYGSRIGVGSIGGVCTLPEERGNGLATVLLEHCARRLIAMGASLMLISGGRGLYTRAGCVPTGCLADFTLKGARLASYTRSGGCSIRPAGEGDALAAARLYQAEAVHFNRPLGRFAEHFADTHMGFQAEKWIVERHARPAAYILLGKPWESANQPEAKTRFIQEYAGSRAAVVEGTLMIMAQMGLEEFLFGVPGQDNELIDLFEQRLGQQPEWISLPDHTARILDFAALMDGLRDYQRQRLPAELLDRLRFSQSGGLIISGEPDADAGSCVIERGADRLELDTASMTRLVMGDTRGRLVVDAPGALREITAALFPLPAFLTGLDYH